MLLTPGAKAIENAAAGAQRAKDLRVRGGRETRECRADTRETGGALIAKTERGVHAPATSALGGGVVPAGHRARAPFASCASTTCRKKAYG